MLCNNYVKSHGMHVTKSFVVAVDRIMSVDLLIHSRTSPLKYTMAFGIKYVVVFTVLKISAVQLWLRCLYFAFSVPLHFAKKATRDNFSAVVTTTC